jgi:hypothetical protein
MSNYSTFMQDNAPSHTAKVTQRFLLQNHVDCMDWPACSPDFNPMENLWHTMKLHLGYYVHETEEELFHNIQHVWHSLKHKYIQNLVSSMALTRSRTDQTRAVRLWGVVVWAFSPFSPHCEIERVNRSQKNKENSNYSQPLPQVFL